MIDARIAMEELMRCAAAAPGSPAMLDGGRLDLDFYQAARAFADTGAPALWQTLQHLEAHNAALVEALTSLCGPAFEAHGATWHDVGHMRRGVTAIARQALADKQSP